jgi:indole-3-glycerol phosphate synthase
LARKVEEVALINSSQVKQAALTAPPARDFVAALRRETVALIAEIKHASPSKGVLIEPFDTVALAKIYAHNGAAAISVLTDRDFFKGDLAHLQAARETVDVPVLRKDFIVDALQVYEGRAAGADAMLLIATALDNAQLTDLHSSITELEMAALVEVHNEEELERVLGLGATLIGVNNRDLKTFHEDLSTTERLARLIPPSVTLVAESAIRDINDVERMGRAGARAILVGEGLIKADNIGAKVREFSSQQRQLREA